ncbi:MAG: TVP38/TMEM64 family protein [Magnetovibrio sp.]|nr:TVP38/TMEM64 family protein [Magnetovibrio sp.]
MRDADKNAEIQGDGDTQPPSKGLKRYILVLIVVGGVVAFIASGAHEYLSFEALSRHRADLLGFAADHGVWAVAAFMVTYVVVIALSLPGGVWLTLAGGFVFGGAMAGVYVVIGATIGATLIFLAARYAFADLFRARAGSALAKMESGFRQNAFNYLLVLRLVPLFPFWLVNLVPALLDVTLRTYVIATFFGIIPGTFVYAYVGAGLGAVFESGGSPDLGVIFQPEVLLPLLGLSALSIVPVIYQKLKNKEAAS